MKTILILFTIVIGLSIFLLLILGKYSQKGNVPGLVNGSLLRCSEKPNCVCSEYIDDIGRYIKPIENRHNIEIDNMSEALATIQEMGGVIRDETDDYVAATFTSSIFGFVDDLEIRNDTIHRVIHLRSASRVGYSDGGVNRKRTELFKKLYGKKIEEAKKTGLAGIVES